MAWTYAKTAPKSILNNKTPAATVTFFDDADPSRTFVEVYADNSFTRLRLEAWILGRVAIFQAGFDAYDAFDGTLGTIQPPVPDPKAAAKIAQNIALSQLQAAKVALANVSDAAAKTLAQAAVDAAQSAFDTAVKNAGGDPVDPVAIVP